MSDMPLPLIPVPIPVPAWLAKTFGYPGQARFVAFCWESAGDEVVYDDGRCAGSGNPSAFLLYRRHRAVSAHLAGYNLGASDRQAEHSLIIDRAQGRAWIAPRDAARQFLAGQHPDRPKPGPAQERWLSLAEHLRLVENWPEYTIDPDLLARWLAEERAQFQVLEDYLDRFLIAPTGPDRGSPAP